MYRVLVVDDNAVVSKTTEHILRKVGYDVEISNDVKQALEMLGRERFDVLITDLTFMSAGGVELIEKIKLNSVEGKGITSILIMTANSTAPCMAQFIEMGVDDYLKKPFSPEELIYRVKRILKDKIKESDWSYE